VIKAVRHGIAGAVAASLAACGAPKSDSAAEGAKLMQTSRDWARVAATGDIDATLSYWADDAVIMPPGEPVLRGKEAIRAYLERSAKVPGFRISWEPLEAKISESGDMGYLIERTQVTINDPTGRPVTSSFRGLTVWRKQADGSWKNAVDVSNAGPPAQP
jgi:uncharacterized protein (TIGR02246 family)